MSPVPCAGKYISEGVSESVSEGEYLGKPDAFPSRLMYLPALKHKIVSTKRFHEWGNSGFLVHIMLSHVQSQEDTF